MAVRSWDELRLLRLARRVFTVVKKKKKLKVALPWAAPGEGEPAFLIGKVALPLGCPWGRPSAQGRESCYGNDFNYPPRARRHNLPHLVRWKAVSSH